MISSLIGPGDIDFHFFGVLGLTKQKLQSHIQKIAKVLAESGVEIELLPDKGICIEIAKKYKEQGGKKVIASLPKSDKTFGILHLKQYLELKIDNKNLFDEIIDTESWFKQDLIKGLLGDFILYLGSSPGTDGELNYAVYLYKLIKNFKENIEIIGRKIHKDIKTENFSVLVYTPFLKNKKLNPELEKYLEKFNIPFKYIDSPEDLTISLKSLL